MSTRPEPVLITAQQFLQIDFGPDLKAELDNGIIRLMAGGTLVHSRIQANVQGILWQALRGSGCHAFGSDLAVNTHDMSVRYPDVGVYCGKDSEIFDNLKSFSDPVMLVEILSPSTASQDTGIKLNEYRSLPSVQTILLIDPKSETVRAIRRNGAANWTDTVHRAGEEIAIPHLNLSLVHAEIFAR